MYTVQFSNQFKRAYKGYMYSPKIIDMIDDIIATLASGKILDKRCYDHQLSGDMKDYRECHIKPDLLLVYAYRKQELILVLINMGTHSELF